MAQETPMSWDVLIMNGENAPQSLSNVDKDRVPQVFRLRPSDIGGDSTMQLPMKILLLLLVILVLGSCGETEMEVMTEAFRPPGVTTLADVDIADVEYEDESVVVDGLISASSQGASSRDEERYNVHIFTIAAWREPGGPINEGDLIVLRSIPQDYEWDGDFAAYSVHRFKLLMSKERYRAVFEELLDSQETDPELIAVGKRLQQPVVIQSARFGELVLDRSIDWFEGAASWDGDLIDVTFESDENGSIEAQLSTADTLWLAQASWKARIEDFAIAELLELKNGNWLQEHEKELTATQFISRITLESVHILPDGEFEFWYDDGGLFWGHAIMVGGNLKDGPNDAGIHG
jgi:hypothetical protein